MESTAPKPFVFVLMPFGPEFDDVYQLGIKAACQEAGTYCERLDEQIFSENMLERIYNQISKADIIIADMSDRNPNVFYEVGYAHALGKRVILITKASDDIPFDLKHYQHIVYDSKISLLKAELLKKVSYFSNEENLIDNFSNINLLIYINEVLLQENVTVSAKNISFYCGLEFTIKNTSKTTLKGSNIRVGLAICDGDTFFNEYRGIGVFDSKDKKRMVYLELPKAIFPDEWIRVAVRLLNECQYETKKVVEYAASVMLYTEVGATEIPFRLLV